MCPKSWLQIPFNFAKYPKTVIAHKKLFLKVRYFERGLSKSPIKVNFIFLSKPVPFNGQSY